MAKVYRERPPPPRTKTTLEDVPDKLLRLILLRVRTPVSLVRAAATCKRWRRHIVLSYFDNFPVHAVAGSYGYHNSGRGPVFVPSSSSPPPPAGEAVDGRHFSLDFLPGGGRAWEVADSNASLLLLARRNTAGWRTPRRRRFPDLAVCEPATRRYQLLPRVEAMRHQHRCLGAYLCGGAAAGSRPTMAAFKVVCVLYEDRTGASGADVRAVRACVFDRFMTGDGRIDLDNGPGWCVKDRPALVRGADSLRFLARNARSLFWAVEGKDDSLLCFGGESGVLLGEFGIFRLPGIVRGSSTAMRVVPSRDYSKMTLISLQGSCLSVFEKPWYGMGTGTSAGGNEWALRKNVDLMEATRRLAGHREEYFCGGGTLEIVTAGMTSAVLASTAKKTWLFSVDLDTTEVTKCRHRTSDEASAVGYPCELPWPPVFGACKIPYCRRYRRYPCSHICMCYH